MSRSRSPLAIIFLVVFIDLLGFGIVLPLLPRYGEHFDADKMTLGFLMASFSAMQFLFAPLWGRLSDRIGRRPVLLVGLAGSTLSYFFFARVTQFGNAGPIFGQSPIFWLFVTRIGAGIAGATIPTAQAYISDVTDTGHRGKGMALIGAAFGIGFTFGPLLGAMFVPAVEGAAPSAAPGYVAAVLSALAFVAAMFLLPESLKPSSGTASRGWLNISALQAALARPYVGTTLACIFLTTFAFAQFESTLSLLTKALGIGAQQFDVEIEMFGIDARGDAVIGQDAQVVAETGAHAAQQRQHSPAVAQRCKALPATGRGLPLRAGTGAAGVKQCGGPIHALPSTSPQHFAPARSSLENRAGAGNRFGPLTG